MEVLRALCLKSSLKVREGEGFVKKKNLKIDALSYRKHEWIIKGQLLHKGKQFWRYTRWSIKSAQNRQSHTIPKQVNIKGYFLLNLFMSLSCVSSFPRLNLLI